MKLLLIGLLALGSFSVFANDFESYVTCELTVHNSTGIKELNCEPLSAQTRILYPVGLFVEVGNKGYSVTQEKLLSVKYLQELGIELKSEAVYPNEKVKSKDAASFTTKMTFVSRKPILLQSVLRERQTN